MIGREPMAIEPERLATFIRTAKCGDRLTYAQGAEPPRASAVWHQAQEYGRCGLVNLHHIRSAHGFDYVAIRRDRSLEAPPPPRAPATARRLITEPDTDLDEAVERIVRRCARLGGILPKNAAIARELSLTDPDAVSYRIGKLVKSGKVRVISDGPNAPRRVELISGKMAVLPETLKARRYG